jgi:crossover junction endodeoxyribonuclease RuvC
MTITQLKDDRISRKSGRILGIDPGSRVTGYGIIEVSGNQISYVAAGVIKTNSDDLGQRLHIIHQGIQKIIETYQPAACSIEQVFVKINVQSALKLGQARGAALAAVGQYALDVFEYSPRSIKQSVCGYGGADKDQIQKMIAILLPKAPKDLNADAADALGAAITHAHHAKWQNTLKA